MFKTKIILLTFPFGVKFCNWSQREIASFCNLPQVAICGTATFGTSCLGLILGAEIGEMG